MFLTENFKALMFDNGKKPAFGIVDPAVFGVGYDIDKGILSRFFGKVIVLDNRECKLKHRIFVVVIEIFQSLFAAFGDGFDALVQIELIHMITSFI